MAECIYHFIFAQTSRGDFLLILLLVLNITAFAFFGIDKFCAKNGAWRIPEKTLFILSLLGGIGAFLGMQFFRHKTQKPIFTAVCVVGVIINALIFVVFSRFF